MFPTLPIFQHCLCVKVTVKVTLRSWLLMRKLVRSWTLAPRILAFIELNLITMVSLNIISLLHKFFNRQVHNVFLHLTTVVLMFGPTNPFKLIFRTIIMLGQIKHHYILIFSNFCFSNFYFSKKRLFHDIQYTISYTIFIIAF